jgi:hypothetical protein
MHPSGLYPVMHYKYFSTDAQWLPAKKDGAGHVEFSVSPPDEVGEVHKRWSTDPNGIQLVHIWPDGPPVGLAPIDKNWRFEAPLGTGAAMGTELKDSIATVLDSVDKYHKKGMDRGGGKEDLWSQSATDYWANWAEGMAAITSISDFQSKPPYCTHDKMPTTHAKVGTGATIPPAGPWAGAPAGAATSGHKTRVVSLEPGDCVTYSNLEVRWQPGGNTATSPSIGAASSSSNAAAGSSVPTSVVAPSVRFTIAKRAASKKQAEGAAESLVDAIGCIACKSPEDVQGTAMEFMLCDFGVEQHGYHVGCVPALGGKPPKGDQWCCPRCSQEDQESGLYIVESVVNKRHGTCLVHSAACGKKKEETGERVGCLCRKRADRVMYHVKWLDFPDNQNTWEFASSIEWHGKDRAFNTLHKGTTKCSSCYCTICLCGPGEAGLKATAEAAAYNVN